MNPSDPLVAALQPLVSRVRTDVTAIKREGRQAWTREPLTPERLAKHLNGGPARGVSQIQAGQSVTLVALLDFDSHGGETPWAEMTAAASRVWLQLQLVEGLQPIAFRSSGGKGVHLYLLWEEPQDAYSVRELLKESLRACGYESGTRGVAQGEVEVFPKQNEVPLGGFGNQAVLPLAGESVPLVYEELVDDLVVAPREAVLGMAWPVNPGTVPVLERPARLQRGVVPEGMDEELTGLLDAIPNEGARTLGYDDWRNVMFAIHHETGGGEDGLALAHAFSAKSDKYDPDFLDARVWPYIGRDSGRTGITRGTLKRIAGSFGWHEPLVDPFEDISAQDDRPPVPQMENKGSVSNERSTGRADVPPPGAPRTEVLRRGIPEAHHLCTDQANANRIKDAYGALVMVAAGRWYVWDGRRWAADEGDVYRYACRLSQLVGAEAKEWAAKASAADAAGDGVRAKELGAVAKTLGAWAIKCEMKGTIEAAVGLLRKTLTVDASVLDADPFALNCLNGIVDLRTGEVRRSRPEEYITRLVPVKYRADATCESWERALGEISGSDETAAFLRRWFGYCLTGDTREQCFVVHWGGGSNGKSTVLGLMAETMGDYAGTAAPGLLASTKGERHPTEIASLAGRRMVTAHESGEGVVLRDDFVKQATGGDRLTARWMREDFFEFEPTHKIQLLTNHKPQIKSQDEGIWRRVLLVPYTVSFGSEEEVREGRRDRLKDMQLMQRLRDELEGVLAWRVRGAVEWFQGGLQAPASVVAASRSYRVEQDRVGQFVEECCAVGVEYEEALTEGMSGGLYPAYQGWAKDGGVFPLSKLRFVDELLRVVQAGQLEKRYRGAKGQQRKTTIVKGVKLLDE